MRIPSSNVATLPNTLLASIPQEEWDVLRLDMRRHYLVNGQRLHERGHSPEHAFFVEDGLVSLVMSGARTDAPPAEGARARRSVQVAMVGRDGLVSGLSLLGNCPAPTDAVMQFPGSALSIPIVALQGHMASMPVLRQACMAYVAALMAQVMETSAESAQQNLVQRCVRWVLMAHERMGNDDLLVTHEALAGLLGVRRPGVTLAMAALENDGLIHTSRGRIRVVERAGLEAVCAGIAYGQGSATRVGA